MLDTLFTYTDAVSVSVEEEVALIEAAQAGDADAYTRLLQVYGPTLRATVNAAKKTIDKEEAQATALLAFAEVLASHDPHDENYRNGRLAARLTPHLKDALGTAQAEENTSFSIPKRTYVRYLGILNAADNDAEQGRALAPTMGMRASTFDEIHAMMRKASAVIHAGDDEDGGEDYAEGGSSVVVTDLYRPYDEVEDRILIDVAFAAVEDEEARICELAYGFTEYEPVPDAEIAHRMGLSRPSVQRKRGKALDKMRKALGVAHV